MTKNLKISFWGVHCWFDPDTTELQGCNWFYDLLVPVVITCHNFFEMLSGLFIPGWESQGFRFKVLERK